MRKAFNYKENYGKPDYQCLIMLTGLGFLPCFTDCGIGISYLAGIPYPGSFWWFILILLKGVHECFKQKRTRDSLKNPYPLIMGKRGLTIPKGRNLTLFIEYSQIRLVTEKQKDGQKVKLIITTHDGLHYYFHKRFFDSGSHYNQFKELLQDACLQINYSLQETPVDPVRESGTS